ncbi:MAG TPA: hypothetical protein VHG09_10125 [Longimicrobiales bacterium]|nr:hypothetical protein [Longimicrobiales bacterium]
MQIERACRATAIFMAIAAGVLVFAHPAHTQQDTLSVAARLVMRQPTGVVLRLYADNEQVTGVLDRVQGGILYLEAPPREIPLSSVTDAWLQRRSTGSGGRLGAAIGAPVGAAVFGLGAWLLSGLCDYDCDISGGEIAVVSLGGAALGAASGYIIGAVVGASVPRWEPLTEESAPATIVAGDPRLHAGLSALSVTPVIARDADGVGGAGAGFAISYLSQLSTHVALGGEAASYDVTTRGPGHFTPCDVNPETLCLSPGVLQSGVWSVGALSRIGSGADRALEPYLLLGLGVTDFGHVRLGGYSAGAGTRYRIDHRFAVSGEARWHSNLTNSGDDSQLGFYTFGIALSLLR